MSSLLDGIETSQIGTAKKTRATGDGLSNTTKIVIAAVALVLAIGLFAWQFQGTPTRQTQLTTAEQEASAKLAKEDVARKAPRQPGQPSAPPQFTPTIDQSFKR